MLRNFSWKRKKINETLEFFVKTMFYDDMKKKTALNFLKMEFYGYENLG